MHVMSILILTKIIFIWCMIFYTYKFYPISLNLTDIRRFGGCDKGMRSIPATDKMW